jgi:hypothetical protein
MDAARRLQRPQARSTERRGRDLLIRMQNRMRMLAAVLVVLAAACAPAMANDYSMARRPEVVFPGSGSTHISPYPAGKRAASVWTSDFCWRDCTGQSAWRFEACIRAASPEYCRSQVDAEDRMCLRTCRTRGGPLLNITD